MGFSRPFPGPTVLPKGSVSKGTLSEGSRFRDVCPRSSFFAGQTSPTGPEWTPTPPRPTTSPGGSHDGEDAVTTLTRRPTPFSSAGPTPTGSWVSLDGTGSDPVVRDPSCPSTPEVPVTTGVTKRRVERKERVGGWKIGDGPVPSTQVVLFGGLHLGRNYTHRGLSESRPTQPRRRGSPSPRRPRGSHPHRDSRGKGMVSTTSTEGEVGGYDRRVPVNLE